MLSNDTGIISSRLNSRMKYIKEKSMGSFIAILAEKTRFLGGAVLILMSVLHPVTAKTYAADNDYELPGEFKASAILTPELLKDKYHTVEEKVGYDGFNYLYTVQSEYGSFQANSTTALSILVHELNAIAAMKQVKTDDTAMASLKKSGENTVTGLKNLFNDPQGTMEGAASGVSSLFNRASETVGKRQPTGAEDSRFEQLIGISKSKGVIATRYGVNVYSSNQVLQEELDRLGQADYLGGLGVGMATSFVPGVGGLVLTTSGTARLLNEAINTTPASELWLQNKNKLLAMGMDADTIELFLNNPVFTPALETVLVTALDSMNGVVNRELFIKVGLQASNPDMARMITEMAVLAAGYHKHIGPLKGFTPMARFLRAEKQDGSVVVLLPTDYIIWSQRIASVADDIVQLGTAAKAAGFEIWTLGRFSDRARASLQATGWQIHEQTKNNLLPQKK